jgi:hypothetical protein
VDGVSSLIVLCNTKECLIFYIIHTVHGCNRIQIIPTNALLLVNLLKPSGNFTYNQV